MKIVEVNAVPYGSTGKIAKEIADMCRKEGHEAYFAYGWTKKKRSNIADNEILIGSFLSRLCHMILDRLFYCDGFSSKHATRVFIKKLEQIKPDIIHLHILHSYVFDVEMLLSYIKEAQIKLVWTFHDCWAFTGGCNHFIGTGCDGWQHDCKKCGFERKGLLQRNNQSMLLGKKIEAISAFDNMTIVSPSNWLTELAQKTAYVKFDLRTINNGIDLEIFKPTDSAFKEKIEAEDKYIVLGVAFGWGQRKGLDYFIKLSKILNEKYQIVLVGVDESIKGEIPGNIITVPRTDSAEELAGIYSSATVFVNPTREDNYPTVNLESIACGTPVVTFDVGGSGETVLNNINGIVVDSGNLDAMVDAIIAVCEQKCIKREDCLSTSKNFDKQAKFNEYVRLFGELEHEFE